MRRIDSPRGDGPAKIDWPRLRPKENAMPGPLDGVRVVDVSAILAGPLAAMMLADQGADVIKIEPPGIGDLLRLSPFRRGGLGAFFANGNRGKRSIVADLHKPEGRQIVLDLVKRADVFVQNFRPGAVERLGIAESDLRAVRPDLIYVSVSGYGESGPYRDRRVYDPILQGLTGHVAIQKNPDVPIPDLIRHVVVDKASAYTTAQAITAALFARERGAGGQHVRVAMMDVALAFLWPDGMMAHTMLGDGVAPGPTLYEIYRLTETADGHLIYFAASDSEFHGLFRALGRPELCEDPRFALWERAKNAEALGRILYDEFHKWSTADILARLVAEDVPCGPVNSLEQVFDDPQVRHNDSVVELEHPVAGRMRMAKPAARFSRTQPAPGAAPPLHGEHTHAILAELGYDEAARAKLVEAGVVPAPT
jgi:crotonobetainyl-CoA:carnitine CoA-transferase CaiB-like acyl-CoA transferase